MKALLTLAASTFVVLVLFSSAAADVPHYLTYQGRLTNAEGQPADTTVNITFELFTAPIGGSLLWSETHTNVEVVDGLFDVLLGSLTPFAATVFDGSIRWLEITIGGGLALKGRKRIASTAYALRSEAADLAAHSIHADTADYVPGVQISGWELSGDYVRLDDINDMVGIGVASPQQKLHLHGNLLLDENFDILWGSSLARLDNSSTDFSIEAADDIFLEPTDKVYIKDIDGSSWMMIDPAGEKVGMGITTPEEMLHLRNDASGGRAYLKIETSHASNWHEAGIRFKTPQNTWYLRMDDDVNNDMPAGGLGLRNDVGGNVMTWTADGKIGLGVESPDELIHIENNASGGRAFLQVEASHATNWHEAGIRFKTPQNTWHLRMDDDANNNMPSGGLGLRSHTGIEAMTWTEDGKVGIGSTNPQQRLHVSGNAKVTDTLFMGAMPEDVVAADNIVDEPGVANNYYVNSVTLTSSYQNITAEDITVPGPGYVLATGYCIMSVDHPSIGWDESLLGITTTTNGTPVGFETVMRLGTDVDAGTFTIPMSCQSVITVNSAATYSFYLVAAKNSSSSGSHVSQGANLILLYVPSAYGSVKP